MRTRRSLSHAYAAFSSSPQRWHGRTALLIVARHGRQSASQGIRRLLHISCSGGDGIEAASFSAAAVERVGFTAKDLAILAAIVDAATVADEEGADYYLSGRHVLTADSI